MTSVAMHLAQRCSHGAPVRASTREHGRSRRVRMPQDCAGRWVRFLFRLQRTDGARRPFDGTTQGRAGERPRARPFAHLPRKAVQWCPTAAGPVRAPPPPASSSKQRKPASSSRMCALCPRERRPVRNLQPPSAPFPSSRPETWPEPASFRRSHPACRHAPCPTLSTRSPGSHAHASVPGGRCTSSVPERSPPARPTSWPCSVPGSLCTRSYPQRAPGREPVLAPTRSCGGCPLKTALAAGRVPFQLATHGREARHLQAQAGAAVWVPRAKGLAEKGWWCVVGARRNGNSWAQGEVDLER